MSSIFQKILLVVGSTLVALLATEGIARLIGVRPEYGILVPLEDVPTRTIDGVTIWGQRFPRVDDNDIRRVANDSDAFKVVGLGDSIMYGVGQSKEETYFEQARRVLAGRTKKPVEVLNLAVPGYNTMQEDALYKEIAPQITPNLVVVHYWSNDWRQYRVVGGYVVDFGDVSEDGRFVVRALPLPPHLSDFLLLHSRLYDLLTHAKVQLDRRRITQEDSFVNVSRPLADIDERVRKSGARLLVLASPELNEEFPQATSDLPLLQQFAAGRGIEVIPLIDWVGGIRSDQIALNDGCHFNAKGHRIIGEHLAEYLLAHDLKE